MKYLITSDVHLGNLNSQCARFTRMVANLDADTTLILAGDIIDAPGKVLPKDAEAALQAVLQRKGPVIWIEGNHDDGYRPDTAHKIQFVKSFVIGQRVYVAHGDDFDNVMPRHRWFTTLFRFFHNLRIKFGADPIHVADYAKRYMFLYRAFCNKVRNCAVDFAQQENYSIVVCGHVHLAEDTMQGSVRYINLGSWTEDACQGLLVEHNGTDMRLIGL